MSKISDYIKERITILDVVGYYIELERRTSKNHVGLCPFHPEKTGSLSINAKEGFFVCFGCQAKGDMFKFIQLVEGCTFMEAARLLAGRYNIPQPVRIYKSHMRARIKELEGQGKIDEAIKLVGEMKTK